MPKSFAELKRAVRQVPISRSGRRRIPAGLREQIVEAALAGREDGRTVTEIARDLGMRDQTLSKWLRKPTRKSAVRAVEVIDDEPPCSTRSLRLILPCGAVVEGLCLDDIARLARASR